MTAKGFVHPLLVVLNSFIEFIFKPFVRRHRPTAPPQEVESSPQFENDGREVVRELTERDSKPEMANEERTKITPIPYGDKIVFEVGEEFVPVFLNDVRAHSPEIRAPKGIALRKSVMFRTHLGEYRSAKVVGWDSDGSLILSRKNGPTFRRKLAFS